jgi:hypothetical protein
MGYLNKWLPHSQVHSIHRRTPMASTISYKANEHRPGRISTQAVCSYGYGHDFGRARNCVCVSQPTQSLHNGRLILRRFVLVINQESSAGTTLNIFAVRKYFCKQRSRELNYRIVPFSVALVFGLQMVSLHAVMQIYANLGR